MENRTEHNHEMDITPIEIMAVFITASIFWLIIPWNDDLSRFETLICFAGMGLIGVSVVALWEMAMELIVTFFKGRRHGN